MFRSATFKLTVWYTAIITALSLIFSIVIYHFATGELQTGLAHQTSRLYRDFPVFNGNPLLQPGADLDTGSHHILLQLVYFNILVMLLGAIVSYFLARQTLEPIEAAHARQQRFTADVSHELRTPLTAMKMTSEVALLDKTATNDELRTALNSNIEEVTKMNALVNNLLRLTKLDDEQTQAGFTQLQSGDIISTAVSQVANLASAKKISIEQKGTSAPIVGDRDALVQLLVILLDNALKYSPQSSVVTITTEGKSNDATISIADEGPGIAKEALPHVFDRFYRADNSRTKDGSNGYGLGLSIAKLIADRHQADITLTSKPGKGTTATVRLPHHAPQKSTEKDQ